jgi:diaminohydroxyphosphoribosylaminopyrimidine deaminase/5-amino-6-(5-phosphoribosylamino)uracil reductase
MMTASIDQLWNILLDFRKQFSGNPSGTDRVSAVIGPDGYHIFPGPVPSPARNQTALEVVINKTDPVNSKASCFFIDDNLMVEVLRPGKLNEKQIEFMVCFLPFCIMPVRAFLIKRAVSIVHLAQTIDGRMATLNHNSKWISNAENLVYVHRMRALSDSILIGAHTLYHDKPALTVRLVAGPNPVKVVIGNSAEDFSSILESKDRIIHLVTHPKPHDERIETVCLSGHSGFISPVTILEELYKLGINSVYIEGGAYTTSSFIRENAADLLNFYIAPVILGSGFSIEFDGISKIEDALSLHNCSYTPMGEGMLIRGSLKQIKK